MEDPGCPICWGFGALAGFLGGEESIDHCLTWKNVPNKKLSKLCLNCQAWELWPLLSLTSWQSGSSRSWRWTSLRTSSGSSPQQIANLNIVKFHPKLSTPDGWSCCWFPWVPVCRREHCPSCPRRRGPPGGLRTTFRTCEPAASCNWKQNKIHKPYYNHNNYFLFLHFFQKAEEINIWRRISLKK